MNLSSDITEAVWSVWGYGLVGVLGIVLLVSGCSPKGTYEARHTDVAQSHLPSEQEMPHHPDTLKQVAIVEGEDAYEFELDEGYESIWRTWSVRRSGPGIRAPRDRREHQWFATFWSLDLSIASLQREVGLNELSKDLARDHIDERRAEYDEVLQIDVYSYTDASRVVETRLDRPGQDLVLHDDAGNEYAPDRLETTIPSEVFHPERQVVYRRTTLYFERDADDRDLLEDVQSLRLSVQPSDRRDFHFRWRFPPRPDVAER